ncbi:hypothetical protein QWY95_19750 [Halomonas neptunia]|uniref:Uncharacterized protein n=1 Tax=Vreelandella neptunia TaxID=115551 RepID=A0ABZ0YJJ4_9GAMM|nr:hypothetical protein [Halomonas neptunia]MDN3562143.1 hypothetical protein [Halomonas neptunia]WQH11844.1 hypothetical protein SR894_17035 [Halomonas neptunia]
MSWLFSQALVAEYSAATCSGGVPSAPLSVMPTQHKFWRNDRTIEPSRLSLFGLTCAVLTESHGEALLTSFLAGSRVRTYPLLEKVSASRASVRGSGGKWLGSFAKFNPDTCSWKTAQHSLLGGLGEFSETWPSWGMAINGDAYQLPTLVQSTKGKGFGLWPTPTVCGNNNRKGLTKKSGDGLATAVKKWPTPNASDAQKWSNQSLQERKEKGQQVRLNTAVAPEGGQGGQLNPTWVEWLMGWPIGWTELKPLEMDKFREWQRQHSPCLVKSEAAA